MGSSIARGMVLALEYEAGALPVLPEKLRAVLGRRELSRRLRAEAAATTRPDPLEAWRRYECGRWSQHGEDGLIVAFSKALGIERGTFVEIGAADGEENCTRALAEDGWSGAWFEGDGDRVLHAKEAVAGLSVSVVQAMVTSKNVIGLLRGAGVPDEPDVFVLDIDGNDYWVLRSVLRGGFRPRLLVLEYNTSFPPGHWWTRRNRPTTGWDETFRHGASLDALASLTESRYALIGCDRSGVNGFFVRRDLVERPGLGELVGTPAVHYRPMASPYPLFGHPKRRWPPSRPLTNGDRSQVFLRSASIVRPADLSPDRVMVEAIIENRSSVTLTSAAPVPVRVTGQWLADDGSLIVEEGERNVLPVEIAPGGSAGVRAVFPLVEHGTCLRLRLVQDGVAWFDTALDLPV